MRYLGYPHSRSRFYHKALRLGALTRRTSARWCTAQPAKTAPPPSLLAFPPSLNAIRCHAVSHCACDAARCYAVSCDAVRCRAMPCDVMRCHAAPCVQCHALRRHAMRIPIPCCACWWRMKVCACHGVDGTGFTTLKRSDVHRLPVMTSRVFIAFP